MTQFPVGAYRETQVWIGPTLRIEDATFVPVPPARVKGCMEEMAASILNYALREDEQAVLTILAQLAVTHAQFETIYPYHDGNGRTGRLLMPLMLAAEGYPPLSPERCCGRGPSTTQRSRASSYEGNGVRGWSCWAMPWSNPATSRSR